MPETSAPSIALATGQPPDSRTTAVVAGTHDAYELYEPVGAGAMATVHVGRSRRGEPVAVKVAHVGDDTQPGIEQRFAIEADRLRTAAGPHVLRVHDSGLHRDRPFLVLDLAHGGSLDTRVGRRVEPAALRRLATDGAAGVSAFHEVGSAHLDVRPANLLIFGRPPEGAANATGQALIDAHERLVVADPSVSFTPANATSPWLERGAPWWRAPEVAAGDNAGCAADVFGLTATLWWMIAGAPPPEHPQRQHVVAAMPSHWQAVFEPGLHPRPDARFRSATHWRDAVLGAVRIDEELATDA